VPLQKHLEYLFRDFLASERLFQQTMVALGVEDDVLICWLLSARQMTVCQIEVVCLLYERVCDLGLSARLLGLMLWATSCAVSRVMNPLSRYMGVLCPFMFLEGICASNGCCGSHNTGIDREVGFMVLSRTEIVGRDFKGSPLAAANSLREPNPQSFLGALYLLPSLFVKYIDYDLPFKFQFIYFYEHF
jgi:hypothetical protein